MIWPVIVLAAAALSWASGFLIGRAVGVGRELRPRVDQSDEILYAAVRDEARARGIIR